LLLPKKDPPQGSAAMLMGVCIAPMGVRLRLQRDGHKTHLAVLHAAFGDNSLGKFPHSRRLSPQHGHLKTVFMIEVNMHRRDVEVVMIVMRVGKPLGQFAGMMVVDIGQRRKSSTGPSALKPGMPQPKARQIAQGLRAVVISIAVHEGRQFSRELLGHADRDPLHDCPPFLAGAVFNPSYHNSVCPKQPGLRLRLCKARLTRNRMLGRCG